MITRTIKRYKVSSKFIALSISSMFFVVMANGVSLVTLQPIIDEIFVASGNEVSFTIPVIKFVVSGSKQNLLFELVLFFVITRVIYCTSLYLNRFFMMLAGEKFVNNLRIDLYEKLLALSQSFYIKNRSGELVSNLTADLGLVQHLSSTITADLIRRPFEIIFLLGLLFAFDIKLALISILVAPFVALIVNKLGGSVRRRAGRMQKSIGDIAATLSESTSGIGTIQSFNAEIKMSSFFKNQASLYFEKAKQAYLAIAAATPVTEFVTALAIAGIIIYGGMSVIDGKTTTGNFFTFMAILMATYQPVKTLVNAISEANRAAAALSRVYLLLDTESEIKSSGNKKAEFKNRIEFKNVSFSYDKSIEKYVLKNISFEIKRGETIAVVGPSGAGKTTLISLIPRFYDPTQGKILFDDDDTKDLELKSLRSKIGMVMQDTFLFNDTIASNISLGNPDAAIKDIERAAEAAFLGDVIKNLSDGLNTVIGERGMTLSGGERQRVAIARAILIDPPILLLDEATSSLDSESEQKVQMALDKLIEGRTAIVIAHRLSTVKKADRIIVLDKGEIVETGTHQELIMQNNLYKRLHDLQFNL